MTTIIRLVSSVLAVVLLLGACGTTPAAPPEADPPATTEETPRPADDSDADVAADDARGTLRIAHEVFWGGAESLDPASPLFFLDPIRMLYDPLVGRDTDRNLTPALAVEWESNDDATVWTFLLRDDVTFHDGSPLTSADVVYTLERIQNPDLGSPITPVLDIIDRVEAPDEQTAVVHLTAPHAEFPILLTSINAHIIPADSGETIGETGIGTGPFQLETLDPTGTTRLIANDAYWQGAPGLAAIEVIGIADGTARFQAFQANQIDLLLGVSPQQFAGLDTSDDITTERIPTGAWYSIEMRTDTPPFDDPRVRKAMRVAVDRQEIIDLVLQGEGTVACDTTVGPDDPYRWDGECPQDSEQAQELLAEAGYPDGLDVTFYVSNAGPWMIPLAEVYQQQAAEAGINVTLEQVPPDRYWTEIWGVEPLFMGGYSEAPADITLALAYTGDQPENATHFDNAEYEQLLADARAARDADERRELYQQAQQFLFEESGKLVPFHRTELRVSRNAMDGLPPVARFDLNWHTVTKDAE